MDYNAVETSNLDNVKIFTTVISQHYLPPGDVCSWYFWLYVQFSVVKFDSNFD
jgi:hypothetical protein